MRLGDLDALKECIEKIKWYHINSKGQLCVGANSQWNEPLYKAEDIYKAIDDAQTIEPFTEVHYETFREYERPHGEWVDGKCDYCGCPCQQYAKNFCGNCGADMGVYNKETTFDDYLKEQLKDPEFRKEWKKLQDDGMQI